MSIASLSNDLKFSTLVDLLHDRALHQPCQPAFIFLQDGETEAGNRQREQRLSTGMAGASHTQPSTKCWLKLTVTFDAVRYPGGLMKTMRRELAAIRDDRNDYFLDDLQLFQKQSIVQNYLRNPFSISWSKLVALVQGTQEIDSIPRRNQPCLFK